MSRFTLAHTFLSHKINEMRPPVFSENCVNNFFIVVGRIIFSVIVNLWQHFKDTFLLISKMSTVIKKRELTVKATASRTGGN